MDERVSAVSPPKTRAEYRAAIREVLDEIRQLSGEMDRRHQEFDRKWAERKAVRARTMMMLDDLQARLERSR